MFKDNMELLLGSSHIFGGNASYLEGLYEDYLVDPHAVPAQWRNYFDLLPRVNGNGGRDTRHSVIVDQFTRLAKHRLGYSAGEHTIRTEYERKQVRVVELIESYRQRGHQRAKLDPLGLWKRPEVADLDIHFHGLTHADLDTIFQISTLAIGLAEAPLRDIIAALQSTYCGTVGSEFMHIVNTEERSWIQRRLELIRGTPEFGPEVKRHLLERLTAAEGLEKYLGSRYPGTKRFGLEGGESFIPMMDELIQRAGSYGVREIVIGMAHRGRLNMLVNILGKNPGDLFKEFDGKAVYQGSADVKYHQGFSSNVMTSGGEVHLALAFNPSHLEIVSPVVEGSVRARQDRRGDESRNLVIPIVVHGDLAFVGQGVVMETFQMSQTRAYGTGGTVHIVINNQVGFTTSRQDDARSTEYCTDIARMMQAPIFHVNGDDPEAVLLVTQLALDYRQKFKKDVVIDLVCYRRRGHHEADEPSGTQPLMYQQIRKQRTTRDLYADRLVQAGILSKEEEQANIDDYRKALETGQHVVRSLVTQTNTELFVDWRPYLGHAIDIPCDTSFDRRRLQELMLAAAAVPEGFVVQAQVSKVIEDRRKMAAGCLPINWGAAEVAAYATLLDEGYPIRLVGQDVGRGTFSHRHAVLHHQKDGSAFCSLKHFAENQPRFTIHDSLLSEEAALAFEYGYSTTTPNALVIWEAQFGDFANGAQVVIDQFITSGETKWQRVCGLTMLLPHGYEGQGPEHSSARLERFMQLCAQYNIQVCIPTTPAQVFHMLRRQVIRPLRKPLIVMSPKSLLRHKEAVSTLEELSNGQFHNVLDETDDLDKPRVTRLVMSAGKVYYELRDLRRREKLDHVAIVRIEQMYPFPDRSLIDVFAGYPAVEKVIWCQEEPQNQGVWYSSQYDMKRVVSMHRKEHGIEHSIVLDFSGREPSASPAAGCMDLHIAQQEKLLHQALGLDT